MNLLFTTPVVIEADLSETECRRRLEEITISRWAIFASRSAHPIDGKIRGNQVNLRWRTFYNNSFQRLLRFSVKPEPVGSRLVGEFSMLKFTFIFSAVWFGFLFFFSIVWTFELLRRQIKPADDTSVLLNYVPYLMMIFGYTLLRFGLWLSSRTEPKLLQFVAQAVCGRVVEGPQ